VSWLAKDEPLDNTDDRLDDYGESGLLSAFRLGLIIIFLGGLLFLLLA
jgi:hypothetical protein